jgi:hypothetical protein
MQYHQGQVTIERLVAQLQAIGVSISKRQVMQLLIDGQDEFLAESREVLRAGLETAAWVTVDDTGARHCGGNAVCTQLEQEKAGGRSGRLAEKLLRYDLIVIDELGYLPFSQPGGQLLFHLISKLYESTSLLITTNLAFADWPQIVGDAKMNRHA